MQIDFICYQKDIELVKKLFRIAFLLVAAEDDKKTNYYCGITNNLGRRRKEHNTDSYLAYVRCNSSDTAKALEEMLGKEGFDAGDQTGNGTDDSIFVYMYKKTRSTNP